MCDIFDINGTVLTQIEVSEAGYINLFKGVVE